MFQYHITLSDWQMKAFGPALYSLKDRIEIMYFNFFLKKSYYFNLFSFISYHPIHINWLYLISFVLGILFTLKRVFQKNKNIIEGYFLLFFVGTFIVSLFYLKLDWERYYLPLVYFIFYFEIKGAFILYQQIRCGIQKKRV